MHTAYIGMYTVFELCSMLFLLQPLYLNDQSGNWIQRVPFTVSSVGHWSDCAEPEELLRHRSITFATGSCGGDRRLTGVEPLNSPDWVLTWNVRDVLKWKQQEKKCMAFTNPSGPEAVQPAAAIMYLQHTWDLPITADRAITPVGFNNGLAALACRWWRRWDQGPARVTVGGWPFALYVVLQVPFDSLVVLVLCGRNQTYASISTQVLGCM